MESQRSKPTSFLSHPLPECSCRASRTSQDQELVKGRDGELLFDGEERCPEWMVRGLNFVRSESGGDLKDEGDEFPGDDELDSERQQDGGDGSKAEVIRPIELDEEMDLDD